MTTPNRLVRADTLFLLLTHLVADDFAGHPACAEIDPELFFPETGETLKAARAKAVCAGCEIRDACAEYAVRRGEPYGVWGGLTVDERRDLRRGPHRRVVA
jgi:WhiB family redox-sensing transcriptional regulator